jgi:peptidyl-prolyl cis-trans isomerase SurA
MNKFFLLGAFTFFISAGYCQTLFTYGNNSVSKDEFLRAYNKNKTTATDKQQAVKEYLDLYTRFKLKVLAAKDMHLDTLPSLQSDLQNFRGQIEENYLKDDKATDALVHEAFIRSLKDIHTQHFYVSFNKNISPTDTLTLYKAINKAYEELKKTGTDFDKAIPELKEKLAPVQSNDLGMITVFTLPYEYENVVYSLKPGEVSKPYRSKNGWHIFINENEEPAEGKIKIAQILFAAPAGNVVMKDKAKLLSDSVYKALKAGADFGEMAKMYSNDRTTYMNKGVIPEFGVAKYSQDFEKMAFSLKHDSDISEPFPTDFGYHIIKRISRSRIPENENDQVYMDDLRQNVLKDSRIQSAKDKFVKEVLVKIGYKPVNSYNEKDLWEITDTFVISNKKIKSGIVNENTVLFSFNSAKIKAGQFMQYARSAKTTYGAHAEVPYPVMLKNYIGIAALDNYKSRLEYFNPDFKYQLQEFKDGNMLFEVMERKVWSKASADSIGLERYYTEHKTSYKWNESADAILYSCSNATVAKTAIDELKKGKTWKEIVIGNPTAIQADSARYELSQIPVIDRTNFTNGLITAPVVNSGDGTTIFSSIIKTYPENQQRTFTDARGLVINDYQNFLEKKWISELEKRYPIKINEAILKSILF